MKEQNFKNHTRLVLLFHGVTFILVMTGLIASIVHFFNAWQQANGRLVAAMLVLLFVIAGLFFWFIRSFPLKAQDRAIRAEENLRYMALTGKLLDSKLRLGQIIALRFAPDEEFVALAGRAVNEQLKPVDIKKSIINWRGDFYRV